VEAVAAKMVTAAAAVVTAAAAVETVAAAVETVAAAVETVAAAVVTAAAAVETAVAEMAVTAVEMLPGMMAMPAVVQDRVLIAGVRRPVRNRAVPGKAASRKDLGVKSPHSIGK